MEDLASILYPNQGMVSYGNRPDGTKKGKGFLGELARPDGSVSTEISAGVQIDGKEMDIPLLVPGLNKKEREYLLSTDPKDKEFFKNMPDGLMDKAVDHANKRIKDGKSVFKEDDEEDK